MVPAVGRDCRLTRPSLLSCNTKPQPRAFHTNPQSNSQNQSQWHRLNHKTYSRPLDAYEKVFHALCYEPSHRSLDIFTTCALETEHTTSEILDASKKVWRKMRYAHPTLDVDVMPDEYRYTVPCGPSMMEDWVERTFIIQDGNSGLEAGKLVTIPRRAEKPMMYYFPSEKRFILTIEHMLIDGRGVRLFMCEFLSDLSSILSGEAIIDSGEEWGSEVGKLPLGALQVAELDNVNGDGCNTLLSTLPEFKPNREAFIFPTVSRPHEAGVAKVQTIEFTKQQTLLISAAAKQFGYGAAAFLHTAILHAARIVCPVAGNKLNSTFVIFDSRGVCQAAQNDRPCPPVAIRFSLWPVQLEMADDLHQTASVVNEAYKTVTRRRPAAVASAPEALLKSGSILKPEFDRGLFPSFLGDTMKSAKYEAFRVREFWMDALPADEKVFLGVQTFDGRLSIRAAYSSQFYEDEPVGELLRGIQSELRAVLGGGLSSF
ncbi:hypothetical protein BO70DRAFT_396426 [Aspergillus heteromorphus CBS 117.55]|uniref:CoA-dependent acyltransferase n=1 Tax=Aspergillus heteromorphus CBS 117.55 TaxID=1448321 RepID=A0A317W7S0_9EURO|nr:uncharacterized protein BO70DRAFT_396426 [Aspergillus heteromorphus CBS 117.55]PWY82129.1 hypothetical protein BO70DRAFT_396426 [Aspergillus heteromorphus CBS 117.55]